jgi:hypothetical protein
MDVFAVLSYYIVDDPYYGYRENLDCIFGSFEEAKVHVDQKISGSDQFFKRQYAKYDGLDDNPYIKIVKLKLGGDKTRDVVYTSRLG